MRVSKPWKAGGETAAAKKVLLAARRGRCSAQRSVCCLAEQQYHNVAKHKSCPKLQVERHVTWRSHDNERRSTSRHRMLRRNFAVSSDLQRVYSVAGRSCASANVACNGNATMHPLRYCHIPSPHIAPLLSSPLCRTTSFGIDTYSSGDSSLLHVTWPTGIPRTYVAATP